MDVGIFVKGIGHAGNRTAALLITSAKLGVLTITPNAHVTRRWNTSIMDTFDTLSNNMKMIQETATHKLAHFSPLMSMLTH